MLVITWSLLSAFNKHRSDAEGSRGFPASVPEVLHGSRERGGGECGGPAPERARALGMYAEAGVIAAEGFDAARFMRGCMWRAALLALGSITTMYARGWSAGIPRRCGESKSAGRAWRHGSSSIRCSLRPRESWACPSPLMSCRRCIAAWIAPRTKPGERRVPWIHLVCGHAAALRHRRPVFCWPPSKHGGARGVARGGHAARRVAGLCATAHELHRGGKCVRACARYWGAERERAKKAQARWRHYGCAAGGGDMMAPCNWTLRRERGAGSRTLPKRGTATRRDRTAGDHMPH